MKDLLNKQERIDYEIWWLTEELNNSSISDADRAKHGAWLDALKWVNKLQKEGNK
jgi:hypothetical protein